MNSIEPVQFNGSSNVCCESVTQAMSVPVRAFMGITFLYAGVQHLTDPAYFDQSKPGYIGHLITQYAVGSPLHDCFI
jgi:hypothetical protein